MRSMAGAFMGIPVGGESLPDGGGALHLNRVWQLPANTRTYVKFAQPLLAITHVRVIDGNGTAPREDQTVVLRDGRIAAVGAHVAVPDGATVIDGSGRTLIPGLVGMHDHMFYPAPRVNPAERLPRYQGGARPIGDDEDFRSAAPAADPAPGGPPRRHHVDLARI
jgi:hypothetical protein